MSAIWLRRFAPLLVAVAAFGACWASIVFAWDIPWWALAAGAVAGISLIAALARPPRARTRTGRSGGAELSASDPYSDAYLGRTPPTPPVVETKPTAQYGPGLPEDPLHLPPERP